MPNYNKVMLMGHLTRDPEVKFTPRGTAACDFSIAVSKKYKTESGEKREEVSFIDVTAWGKTAEVIGEHFQKGQAIFVEGELKQDRWDDKTTGDKRSKIKVTCHTFEFVGRRMDAPDDEDRPSRQAPSRKPTPPKDPDLDPDDDSSTPF